MSTNNQLTDQQFMAQFEALTLDPVHFNHLGHLRMAWLYLLAHDLEAAVNKVCGGIKAYAESLGAKDKFEYDLTETLVRIEHQRMGQLQQQLGVSQLQAVHWDDFIVANQDLVKDAKGVVKQAMNTMDA